MATRGQQQAINLVIIDGNLMKNCISQNLKSFTFNRFCIATYCNFSFLLSHTNSQYAAHIQAELRSEFFKCNLK